MNQSYCNTRNDYNPRAKRSVYRKAEIKRLMAAGHTKKRAQQIAKGKEF